MSDTALFISLAIVFTALIAMLLYIIIGRRRQMQNKNSFRWQPEQDYDVEMRGETPMSPGFPTLVKRKNPANQTTKNSETGNSSAKPLD